MFMAPIVEVILGFSASVGQSHELATAPVRYVIYKPIPGMGYSSQ